jgi:hypothetical protein
MLWLNLLLGFIIFVPICGIPLWMVNKHPDITPDYGEALRLAEVPAHQTSGRTAADADLAA